MNGDNNAAVIQNDPTVNAAVPIFDLSEFERKYDELKSMAREGQKKGEIAKHRTPQIKRSMGVLMDLKFGLEDLKELFEKIAKDKAQNNIDDRDFSKVSSKMTDMEKLLSDEMDANKIASKSPYSWRTVKFFESDDLFQGDDAEALTKKLRSAEYQAGRGRRARGMRRGFYGRGGAGAGGSGRGEKRSADVLGPNFPPRRLEDLQCFGCLEFGHIKRDCPKKE